MTASNHEVIYFVKMHLPSFLVVSLLCVRSSNTLTPMNSTTILLFVGCIYTVVGNDKSIAPEDSTLPVNIFDVL
jgi:hypothetical protein